MRLRLTTGYENEERRRVGSAAVLSLS